MGPRWLQNRTATCPLLNVWQPSVPHTLVHVFLYVLVYDQLLAPIYDQLLAAYQLPPQRPLHLRNPGAATDSGSGQCFFIFSVANFLYRMEHKKRFRASEVHAILDALENDPNYLRANVFLLPPSDPNCSDEDSGAEDAVDMNNFTRRQLEAEAEVTIYRGDDQDEVRIGHSCVSDDDNVSPLGTPTPAALVSVPSLKQSAVSTTITTSAPSTPVSSATSSVTRSKRCGPVQANSSIVSCPTTPTGVPAIHVSSTSSSAAASNRLRRRGSQISTPQVVAKKSKSAKQVRQWKKKDLPKSCRALENDDGCQYATTDCTPTALFEKFFDDEVIQLVLENSNKYALQKGKHSFLTAAGEMRIFLAILFTSGYAPLPRRKLYWDPTNDVNNAAITNAMTRNRFEELMSNIHVADNDNLPPNDRMAKVRPLFTALNARFVKAFPRQRNLSVDESMVPYYGRHSAKQFIRGKPIRFGYKVWSINTPIGYCVQLEPYQGAGVTTAELGLGGSVVVNLASSLPPDKYVLYFDNFFTSLRLLQHLDTIGMQATGTVRANRIDNCPVLEVDKMKKTVRGTSDYRLDTTSNILVARWNDNSVVTLASNCHGMEPAGSAKRWSTAEKRRIEIPQPYLIGQYNKNMGGVDRMDQNIATYRISIRSRKWWWPLFAYMVDVAMQNAWLIYRLTGMHCFYLSHVYFDWILFQDFTFVIPRLCLSVFCYFIYLVSVSYVNLTYLF